MGCLPCSSAKEADPNEDLHGGDDFIEGGKRRCTDVLFLLIFVTFWVGMIGVGAYGFANGKPEMLVMGTDYEGVMCGDSGTGVAGKGSGNAIDNTEYTTRYWVNFLEVLAATKSGVSTLIMAAGTAGLANSNMTGQLDYSLADAKSVCLKTCPQPSTNGTTWVCDYPESHPTGSATPYPADITRAIWGANSGDVYSMLDSNLQESSKQLKGPCYPVFFPTINTYFSCNYYGNFSQQTFDDFTSGASPGLDFFASPEYSDYSSITNMVGSLNTEVTDYIAGPMERFQRYIEDFLVAWEVLAASAAVCLVLSLVWLLLLRYCTAIFCWSTVFMVNLGSIAVTLYLAMKAGLIGHDEISSFVSSAGTDVNTTALDSSNFLSPTKENEEVLKCMCYFSAFATCLFFLFTLLMVRRLRVAIACIKVSISAFATIPTLVFYPLFPAFGIMVLFLYWCWAGIYLMSCGDQSIGSCTHPFVSSQGHGCGIETDWNRGLQYMLLYHFFGFLWSSQFIIALSYLVVAYVFAKYYWSGPTNLGAAPLVTAMRRMPYYHSGSAAFGSFLIAVMQFFRISVRLILSGLKKIDRATGVGKVFAYVIECFLWACQKIIEFINRNAYIMIVIDGNSFCWSAFQALKLLMSNVLAVAAINIVGDLLLFLAKLSISVGTAFFAFVMLDSDKYTVGDSTVSSPVLICAVLGIFAYAVASVFMGLVEMGIDTTLLSYCRDMEKHGGTPRYAPQVLQDALGIAGEVTKQEEERKASREAAKAAVKDKK